MSLTVSWKQTWPRPGFSVRTARRCRPGPPARGLRPHLSGRCRRDARPRRPAPRERMRRQSRRPKRSRPAFFMFSSLSFRTFQRRLRSSSPEDLVDDAPVERHHQKVAVGGGLISVRMPKSRPMIRVSLPVVSWKVALSATLFPVDLLAVAGQLEAHEPPPRGSSLTENPTKRSPKYWGPSARLSESRWPRGPGRASS